MRFGIVGAGGIASAYADALARAEEAELVAVADPVAAAREKLAEAADCAAFESHERLAESGECEAVIVCTPPVSHADISVALMQQGLHVLCEKPLAIHACDARRMLDAAAASSVVFTMGSKFRYVADVEQAREFVLAGRIGEVTLFENSFTGRVDMSQRWNSKPEISGGGVLIDNGTHSVDVIRYFVGDIREVQAVEGKRLQGLRVEDTAQLFIRAANGAVGTVDLSWSLDKAQDHFLHIYGSEGIIRVGWKGSQIRNGSDAWESFGTGYDKGAAFRNQVQNFMAAIRGDEELRISADDAIASVRVIDAAYRSLAISHWVPVAAPE